MKHPSSWHESAAFFAIIALAVEKQLMTMGNGVTAAPATLTRIV